MTQERFSRIVDDPDILRTITYEELKTLALAYPYAHNLRYLLAIKARQTDHQDVVKNVATAAAYSLDRTQLFRLVAPQMIAPQEVWVEEAVLELKPIETLKRKLEEELSAVNRDETPTAKVEAVQEAAPPISGNGLKVAETIPVREQEPSETIEAVVPKIPYQTFNTWIGKFNPLPLELEPLASVAQPLVIAPVPVPKPTPIPRPKMENQILETDEDAEDAVPENTRALGVAQTLAEKSVAENKDVISETLAKLYAKQGYRDKAIAMYERLGLAFPEKSAYFAAEIDKLKK